MRIAVAALLVLAAACGPKKKAVPEMVPAEPLPSVLAPLTWKTTLSDLAKQFPKVATDVTRFVGLDEKKMVAESLIRVEWPMLGPALVTLTRVPNKAASEIRVEGNGGARGPTPHNPDLVKRFDALKAALEKSYGPPHATELSGNSTALGLPRDDREVTVSWQRAGFDVFLSLQRTELDGWVVSLAAVRRGAPL